MRKADRRKVKLLPVVDRSPELSPIDGELPGVRQLIESAAQQVTEKNQEQEEVEPVHVGR